MNPEHFNPIGKGKPTPKDKVSGSKRRMLKVAKEWKPITSPKLCEAYSAKVEWAKKLIPKLKKEAEAR